MTTKSLSDLWRENRSKDPGTDIASVLDGARIIAQSLVPNTEVTFAGIETASTDRKQITLTSKLLGNEYPVPGDVVDVLLGLTVHEVGHILFSKDRIGYVDKMRNKAHVYDPKDIQAFGKMVDIFEDIYIDHLMTAYPGYRDYLKRERAWALGGFNPDSVFKPLEAKCTRLDMLNAMIYLTLYDGKMPQGISQDNIQNIGNIAALASKMCTKKVSKERAVLLAWKTLKELPTILTDGERGFGKPEPEPEPQAKSKPGTDTESELKPTPEQAQEDRDEEEKEQEKLEAKESEEEQSVGTEEQKADDDEDEEGKPKTEGAGVSEDDTDEEEVDDSVEDDTDEENEDIDPNLDLAAGLDSLVDDTTRLPHDLAEDVSEAIVEKRADLTQLLSLLAKDSHYTIIAYTPQEDAERTTYARNKTSSAEEKLRRIIQDYRLRRTKDFRGLMSGRISSRRLHRVAYGDQRVFQRRERPEEIDMAVCLLMDLSGSVYGKRDLIEQIVCAITDAFTKEKLEFIALGYSEDNGTVNIPRLYDKEVGKVNLGLDKVWGMTPSYEGLAAATAQLLRLTGNKQKILFHCTDGSPNVGGRSTIPELLNDARAKGIVDIHIGLISGGHNQAQFRALYGEDAMIIDDINQLPDIVDQELRKRLKI